MGYSFGRGTCPKCKHTFAWVDDRPPCPECGHQLSAAEFSEMEEALEKARQEMLADADDEPEAGSPAQQ